MENVTLNEVIAASRDRHASMVPESAGYLLLGVVRAMGGRPAHAPPGRVVLSVDGAVAISGQRKRQSAEQAAQALQRLLGDLLAVANGKSQQLRAIADGETPSLEGLFSGITKALIPINRGAAKRALGRLARETLRAKARGLVTVEEGDTPSPLPALPRRPAAPEAPAVVAAEPVVEAPVAAPEPVEHEVVHATELAPHDWPELELEGDIDLATPTPAPAVSIELATPTPAPVAPRVEAPPAPPSDEPAPLPLLCLAPPPPFVLLPAPSESESELSPGAHVAPFAHRDAIMPAPFAPAPTAPSPTAAPTLPTEALAEVAPPMHAEPEAPTELVVSEAAPAVVESGDEAPFSRVTPLLPAVEESPSPEGVSGGTPTIVDASLYALTARISLPDLDARISALSVELPQAEADDDEPAHVAPESDEIDVEFSEEPPAARAGQDVAAPLPDVAERAPEAAATDQQGAEVAEPLDALEQEARMAERLLALAEGRLSSRSTPEEVARRDMARGGDRDHEGARTNAPDAVEALLERFGEGGDGRDAVSEAAASLKRMMSLELTPPPVSLAASPRPSTLGGDADMIDDSPSVSPLPAMAIDPAMRLTPTRLSLSPATSGRRRWLAVSAAVTIGAAVIGWAALRHPAAVGMAREVAQLGAPAAEGAPAPCYADLTLKDLPAPHEVLLRLGQGSFTTRSLPTGVRLELVGLAPGHRPRRVFVPADAEWIEGADGARSIALAMTLEAGDDAWPAAPAGEVGGVGPRGTIDLTTTPAEAEIWLVAAAGTGARSAVSVPCESAAHLLVINPADPRQQRRLSVAPELLAAAVRTGGAELSVKP